MLVPLLTATLGVPLLVARVSGPPEPVLIVQPCVTDGFKSSKISEPAVRAPSSVTVRFAARFKVLKSAAASVPPAMSPPYQLVPPAQEPPSALVQTPEPAGAEMTKVAGALVTLPTITV